MYQLGKLLLALGAAFLAAGIGYTIRGVDAHGPELMGLGGFMLGVMIPVREVRK